MRLAWLAVFFVTMSAAAAHAVVAGELLSRVKEKYRDLNMLAADVDQTKTSPYLSRPLKSVVRMALRSGIVTWETVSPVPSMITLTNGQIVVTGAGQTQRTLPRSPQADALLTLIEGLVRADWLGLERDCVITATGALTLQAVPRPASKLVFLKNLEFRFHDSLKLERITITTADETTELAFRTLTLGGMDGK